MNTTGRFFRVTIFGESHGDGIGAVIDGVTPGLQLSEADFTGDLARRKAGAAGTTPRCEADTPRIVSGVFEGRTTGAPLTVLFTNENTRSADYERLKAVPRPGHADYPAAIKFKGFNDIRGGGHFSGRLTLAVVAAGVVAKKMLPDDIKIEARIAELGGSPDESAWKDLIARASAEGDSLGAIVGCRISGAPAGLGEPFWDSAESLLSHALFSIPGVRGVEFGDGFAAAAMKGSAHNDPIGPDGPVSCHAGGINGGITNGGDILFRVAFKPTSSIRKPQRTLDTSTGAMTDLSVPGRHDTCFALRAPVVVEAAAAIVLADLMKTSN